MRPNKKIQQGDINSPPKIRHARLEKTKRSSSAALNGDDQYAWAVSYSDMLMVLMSFFVIFFSFDQSKRENVLTDIAVQIQTGAKKKTPQASHGDSGQPQANNQATKNNAVKAGAQGTAANASSVDSIMNSVADQKTKQIPGIRFEKTDDKDRLVIHLSNDLYPPRGVDLTGVAIAELNAIFTLLKPHAKNIDLYFVGHTDPSPVTSKSRYLTNNFALASIRAVRAIDFAEKSGFAMDHLFTQGPGSNWRKSRSLSIIVQNRVESLSH